MKDIDNAGTVRLWIWVRVSLCCLLQTPNYFLLRKEQKTLTATEATRELDFKGSAQSIAESQLYSLSRDRVDGLEAAVSVHIKPEEAAVTDGICILAVE